jgi:hypothetical protein
MEAMAVPLPVARGGEVREGVGHREDCRLLKAFFSDDSSQLAAPEAIELASEVERRVHGPQVPAVELKKDRCQEGRLPVDQPTL